MFIPWKPDTQHWEQASFAKMIQFSLVLLGNLYYVWRDIDFQREGELTVESARKEDGKRFSCIKVGKGFYPDLCTTAKATLQPNHLSLNPISEQFCIGD